MRLWTEPSLVQVIAYRLFRAKPLPEPMLIYCQIEPYEQSSVKFYLIEAKTFSLTKLNFKMSYAKVVAIFSRPQCVNVVGDYKLHVGTSSAALVLTQFAQGSPVLALAGL